MAFILGVMLQDLGLPLTDFVETMRVYIECTWMCIELTLRLCNVIFLTSGLEPGLVFR